LGGGLDDKQAQTKTFFGKRKERNQKTKQKQKNKKQKNKKQKNKKQNPEHFQDNKVNQNTQIK